MNTVQSETPSVTVASLREKFRTRPSDGRRWEFLAYGFLRKKPYREIEFSTRDPKKVPAWWIAKQVGVTVEEVKEWAAVPPTPELVKHHAASRAAYMAAKVMRSAALRTEREKTLGPVIT